MGFGSVSGRPPTGSQVVPPQFEHVGSADAVARVIELSQLAHEYVPGGAWLPAVRFDIRVLSRVGVTGIEPVTSRV
jgi:hypothetical protein